MKLKYNQILSLGKEIQLGKFQEWDNLIDHVSSMPGYSRNKKTRNGGSWEESFQHAEIRSILKDGNNAVGEDIKTYSILERISCPFRGICDDFCYSEESKRSASAMVSRLYNYFLSRNGELYDSLKSELSALPNGKVVRIHVDGDFYNSRYLQTWTQLCLEFPRLQFFAYTKSFPLFETMDGKKPGNLAIRLSSGGKLAPSSAWERVLKAKGWTVKGEFRAVVPGSPNPPDLVHCHKQSLDRTCSDCGLCWKSEIPIFINVHANPGRLRKIVKIFGGGS